MSDPYAHRPLTDEEKEMVEGMDRDGPVTKEERIEEEVYRLEKSFCLDDLFEAISESSAMDQIDLFESLRDGEAQECLFTLRAMRDAWIKSLAEHNVERDS